MPIFSARKSTIYLHNEASYATALKILTRLLEMAPNDPNAPEHNLIELLAGAVELYEKMLPETRAWQCKGDEATNDVSLLRLLMDQHGLTASDFEHEIGKKSYVNQILAGEKS